MNKKLKKVYLKLKKKVKSKSFKVKAILSLVAALFLLGWGVYTKSLRNTVREQENAIENSINIDVYHQFVDSIKKEGLLRQDSLLSAKDKHYQKKIAELIKQGNTYENDFNNSVDIYITDSIVGDPCKDIIEAGKKTIDKKNEAIDSLEVSNNIKENRLAVKDSLNAMTQKDLDNCRDNVEDLNKTIAKDNTWLNRNKFGIGVGTGVVITTGLAYIISRLAK